MIHIPRIQFLLLLLLLFSCKKNQNPVEPTQAPIDICYNALTNNGRWIICINSHTGNSKKTISRNDLDDCYNPKWSPDGNFVIYRYDSLNSCSYIKKYSLIDEKEYFLTEPSQNEDIDTYPLYWMPYSNRIIYDSRRIGEPSYIYSMDENGNNKIRLVENVFIKLFSYNDGMKILSVDSNNRIYSLDIIENNNIEMLGDFFQDSSKQMSILDFNGENKLLVSINKEILLNFDINTLNQDTLYIAEDKFNILRGKYTNSNINIAFIERDYTTHTSKLLLININERQIKEVYSLTDDSRWFDYHEMQFKSTDEKLLIGINQNVSNEFVSWTSILYCFNMLTFSSNIVDQNAVDGQWR